MFEWWKIITHVWNFWISVSLNTAGAPKNESDAEKYIKADDSPENTWDGLTWIKVSANSGPSFS